MKTIRQISSLFCRLQKRTMRLMAQTMPSNQSCAKRNVHRSSDANAKNSASTITTPSKSIAPLPKQIHKITNQALQVG